RGLLQDRSNDARTNRTATFTDSEAELLFHGDRNDQLNVDVQVVARHHHFGAFGKRHDAGHVRGTEVELRTVVAEERSVTAAFFLGEDVHLSSEVGVRGHGTGLAENLAALNLSAVDTTDQGTNVVASLARIEQLAEHFDT